jgi:two-component system, chemotaxis family, chemotaxis protein CheY
MAGPSPPPGILMVRINFNRMRFLVSDDNAHMRRIMRSLLHGLGTREVYEAEDGAAGRSIHPIWSGNRHYRLGDANLRWSRAGADDPPTGRQRQSLRAHHHADRPFGEKSCPACARRRHHRIPRQADLGHRTLRAHSHPRCQSAPVHQNQDLFGPDRRRNGGVNYLGPERRRGGTAEFIHQQRLLDKVLA